MQGKYLIRMHLILIILTAVIFNILVGCGKKSLISQVVTPPFISQVHAVNISASQATITWLTCEPATSQMDYGPDTDYSIGVFNSNLVTKHSINIRSLEPGQTYHFNVYGVDSNSNVVVDVDRTFNTPR
jgi:hypothetical protein